MLVLCISFVLSLLATLLLIRYDYLHSHLSSDHDLGGIQKFHVKVVPRIGGLGVFIGAILALLSISKINPNAAQFGLSLFLCSIVVYITGLLEDLTKKIGVKQRLVAMLISALLAGVLMGSWIKRLDLFILDQLFSNWLIYVPVTCVAIVGATNAYNIIDGYNGLVGVVAVIVLLGISYVAKQVGDLEIITVSLCMAGSIIGYLLWNYPYGLIFLGDGGAYLIGFMISELSVLLVDRNPSVSPFFPLLLSFYPIFETIFSIYRKKIKRGISPALPDGLHLHMLIYKRVVRWAVGDSSINQKTFHNALTSPYLWCLSCFAVMPALLFWDNTLILILFILAFSSFYILIYRKIVRTSIPTWLILRRHRKDS